MKGDKIKINTMAGSYVSQSGLAKQTGGPDVKERPTPLPVVLKYRQLFRFPCRMVQQLSRQQVVNRGVVDT